MTDPDHTIQALQSRVAELEGELAETLEQMRGTRDVLDVISRAPSDLQTVLDEIVLKASSLLQSRSALVLRETEGRAERVALARGGSLVTEHSRLDNPTPAPPDDGPLRGGRSLMRHGGPDAIRAETPALAEMWRTSSVGSSLTAPLVTSAGVFGRLVVSRESYDPYRRDQVALLETFADQAVIAIENARLFSELQGRNQEVTEALDQQSSTSSVLAMISRSPGQVEDVLVEVAREAMRLCGGDEAYLAIGPEDGEIRRMDITAEGVRWYDAREYGLVPERPADTAYLEEQTIHVYGTTEEMLRRFPAMLNAPLDGLTVLATPFRTVNGVVGFLNVRRLEIRPFSEREIGILETFADQAVIAIENARLFSELHEAVEQLQATAEVLEIVSKSQTSLEPVFQAIARFAAQLCDADDGSVVTYDGQVIELAARFVRRGDGPHELDNAETRFFGFPPDPDGAAGRAILGRRTVHVWGTPESIAADLPRTAKRFAAGMGALVVVPLISEGRVLGLVNARRRARRPFSDKQIVLLETFAAQAVIAIENARLFNELQERNREVTEALDRQTAMAEVLEIISRSATDAQPVLDAVTERAAQLCDAEQCVVHAIEGNLSWLASRYVRNDHVVASYPAEPSPIHGRHLERAVTEQRVQHFFGTLDELSASYPRAGLFAAPVAGDRITVLSVPLIRDHEVIGVLQPTRPDGRPFDTNQISLVEAFADQAVIAIENARLFNELQAKTEELGKLNIELETASRHKSDFLANMSHELRTPLNAIIGYSELLQEECADLGQEGFIPDLRKIHSAGTHLLTLISGILDLAKVEAGRMTMYLEEFDVAQLVGEVDAIVRPLVEKNANAFTVSCSPDVGRMRADLVKTRQVLFNLLSNAAKFTSSGNIWLTVERVADPDVVRFAVRDSGIGISEEQMSRLFEAFSQADSSTHAKYGGTGLGLSLSRRFCLMMGGDIVVDTAPGVGSTFTVTLPTLVVEHAPAQPSSATAAPGEAG